MVRGRERQVPQGLFLVWSHLIPAGGLNLPMMSRIWWWILQGDLFPPSQSLTSSHRGRFFGSSYFHWKFHSLRVPGICPGLVPPSCILRIQILLPCHHRWQPWKQASKASFSEHPRMAAASASAILIPAPSSSLFPQEYFWELCCVYNVYIDLWNI